MGNDVVAIARTGAELPQAAVVDLDAVADLNDA